MAPDFLENNFLSNDKRYPLTKIETNSARAFATNAKADHIWDNFSSLTYKELSPVDELEFFNPFDETHQIKFKPKDKNVAPGYYRTPSLVSVWSSAPLFHNNALGKFTGDPSVAGRMDAFSCTSRSSIKSMTLAAKSVNATRSASVHTCGWVSMTQSAPRLNPSEVRRVRSVQLFLCAGEQSLCHEFLSCRTSKGGGWSAGL
jgi:hypothetical protein